MLLMFCFPMWELETRFTSGFKLFYLFSAVGLSGAA
jgi:hypothetical protein